MKAHHGVSLAAATVILCSLGASLLVFTLLFLAVAWSWQQVF